MKKQNISILYILGIIALLVFIFNGIKKQPVVRTISVKGECTTNAPKDMFAVTLQVRVLDKSANKSMKIATDKMAQITNFLKTQDLKMQTTGFNSYEETEWNPDTHKSEVLGTKTSISVEVSADNIEKIETVLNEFAGEENVYTQNFHMFTSDKTLKPITENCMSKAVENARLRANALAKGDNKKAGKLLSVSYGTSTNNEYHVMPMMKTMALDSGIDTSGSFVSTDTEITVSVSATFEIR